MICIPTTSNSVLQIDLQPTSTKSYLRPCHIIHTTQFHRSPSGQLIHSALSDVEPDFRMINCQNGDAFAFPSQGVARATAWRVPTCDCWGAADVGERGEGALSCLLDALVGANFYEG